MHDYQTIKKLHGSRVSQTIDAPILIFDFWELSDAFIGLMIVLVFGVLFYSWGLMMLLLILALGIGPVIKRRNKPGIFFHWPYRHFWIELPGLINPRGRRKYSD
jgi:hypothetical protein